jgi:hypothetical protein
MRAERFRGSPIRSRSWRNKLIERGFVRKPGCAGLFVLLRAIFRPADFFARRVFTDIAEDGFGKVTVGAKKSTLSS